MIFCGYSYWTYYYCHRMYYLLLLDLAFFKTPSQNKEGRAACVILATALLWMTEAMPLMITGLVPAVMFPLVGIMDTKEVSLSELTFKLSENTK